MLILIFSPSGITVEAPGLHAIATGVVLVDDHTVGLHPIDIGIII